MTTTLFFQIEPMAVQSFRFTRTGHRYQPAKVVDYKTAISTAAYIQLPPNWNILTGAISVNATFTFTAPKATGKADLAILQTGGSIPKTTRPDCDNLWKGAADALTGVVWKDDSQITSLTLAKVYGLSDSIKIEITGQPSQPVNTTAAAIPTRAPALIKEKPRWRETLDYSSDAPKPHRHPATPTKRASGHARLF